MSKAELACEGIADIYSEIVGVLVGSTSQAGRALFERDPPEKCPVPVEVYKFMQARGFPVENFEKA